MSGKTTKLELPYPIEGESADVPRDIKALAERAETVLKGSANQLLIVQNTGAPAAKALKGDATLATDGTLTVADGAVTSRKSKLTTGIVRGTGSQVNQSTSYQDIAGTTLTITPAVPSYLRIWSVFYFWNGGTMTGIFNLDGVDQTATSVTVENPVRLPAPYNTILPLSAAEHKIKMRSKNSAAGGFMEPPWCYYMYDLVAQ